MTILTYLQTKTKADDLSIRLANFLMVVAIICGINVVVAMNALNANHEEEIQRRREDDWDGLADWDGGDDKDSRSTLNLKGRIYVLPGGRLRTVYSEDMAPDEMKLQAVLTTNHD